MPTILKKISKCKISLCFFHEINLFLKISWNQKFFIYVLGDKDQEERNKAVQEFKSFVKDVLVATDVASKGLGK